MEYLGIGIGVVIVLLLIFFIVSYNKLVKINNETNEAFSTMDVYLKKRWDMIPNLVETVKGYAKHEQETLTSVMELRNGINSYEKLSPNEKIKANKEMSSALGKLLAVAEAYPELKANENFSKLQDSLEGIEDEISQSRKYYNAVVKNYNNTVQMFPSNIAAKIFGYKIREMFEVIVEERENVKVSF